MLAFEEGGGGVACGAFEDVGEAAGDVGEFLLLWGVCERLCERGEGERRCLPCRCRESPVRLRLHWM